MTLPAMGAEPVTISLHRPPRMALVFLKIILSHSQCVYLHQHVNKKSAEAVDLIWRALQGGTLALRQARGFCGDRFADQPCFDALDTMSMGKRYTTNEWCVCLWQVRGGFAVKERP